MKIHIEIAADSPAWCTNKLLAMLGSLQATSHSTHSIPAIRDKWQDTDAIYAGISLSKDGDKLVHLILWPDNPPKKLNYDDGVKWAEERSHLMSSHMPTRHQSIDLFERLQDQFKKNDWYWTLTKMNDSEAFFQFFGNGGQGSDGLYDRNWVSSVSEILL